MNLSAIKAFIEKNDNFVIIGHTNPDGDCIGSCLGLWHVLKKLGKKASVKLSFNDYPENLKFLYNGNAYTENTCFDAYIALDCADIERLSCMVDEFKKATETACIDHHRTNSGFAAVNAVIPSAAATGEIIYRLATEQFGLSPEGDMAQCIYAAIVSDTGGFKYSSTTGDTMRAGAALIDCGVDSAGLYKKMFDTYSQKQIEIISDVTSTLSTHFDGKAAVISVTDELLSERGMRADDVDFLVSLPRSIEGCQVGVFLKKRGNTVKVSLRSGESVDVSKIALRLGGGGHMRAAGITLEGSLQEVKKIILDEIEKEIN